LQAMTEEDSVTDAIKMNTETEQTPTVEGSFITFTMLVQIHSLLACAVVLFGVFYRMNLVRKEKSVKQGDFSKADNEMNQPLAVVSSETDSFNKL